MTRAQLKSLFPNASESFLDENADDTKRDRGGVADPVRAAQPQRMARQRVEKASPGQGVGSGVVLRAVDVEFHARHGRRLDQDNARYVVKPILDAIVNLGFAADDAAIEAGVVQRMDEGDDAIRGERDKKRR